MVSLECKVHLCQIWLDLRSECADSMKQGSVSLCFAHVFKFDHFSLPPLLPPLFVLFILFSIFPSLLPKDRSSDLQHSAQFPDSPGLLISSVHYPELQHSLIGCPSAISSACHRLQQHLPQSGPSRLHAPVCGQHPCGSGLRVLSSDFIFLLYQTFVPPQCVKWQSVSFSQHDHAPLLYFLEGKNPSL